MTILVVGDSFSFGSELSDLPPHPITWHGNKYFDPVDCELKPAFPSQLAWPALLGKKLGCEIENISVPGSSNDRIFRKSVTYSIVKSYDLIICAWTNVDRYDLSWNQQELQLSVSNPMKQLDWFKSFVAEHHDSILAYQRWLSQVISLQALFKSKNQPYLFVNAISPSIDLKHLNIDGINLDIKSQIDHENYIDWDSNLRRWCRHLPTGPGGHFLEEGHQLVADRFSKIIKDKFLIHRDV